MKTTLEWQNDVVLMPVPLRFAQEVAEFAATLASGKGANFPDVDVNVSEAVVVPDQGSWTRDMVDSLVDAVTYGAVLALIDRCAHRPGQWTPKSEVEEAHGFSPIQLRNELGALSKKTIKLFGTATWPMEWGRSHSRW